MSQFVCFLYETLSGSEQSGVNDLENPGSLLVETYSSEMSAVIERAIDDRHLQVQSSDQFPETKTTKQLKIVRAPCQHAPVTGSRNTR